MSAWCDYLLSRDLSMPLPDHVNARIRRSIEDLFSAELGTGTGALQDAMRPMLQRAFVRGMGIGVSLSATASGQGIETLKSGLIEDFGITTPAPAMTARTANRPRVARASKSGKPRAAPCAVGQAIELVLADQPGLRIVEIQAVAVGLDPTISRSSIVNELRRKLGTRYRQEGVRWYRIGDAEKESAADPSLGPGLNSLADGSGRAAA
jgi:hypothetical protein